MIPPDSSRTNGSRCRSEFSRARDALACIRDVNAMCGRFVQLEVMHEWIGVDPELAGEQLVE
jgi:hypothetical protein